MPAKSEFVHREVLAERTRALPEERRPQRGAITVLPEDGNEAPYQDAIRAAGGTIVPLGDETRGIVYTSYRDVDGLIAALEAHPEVSWVQLPYAGIDAFAERLAPHAKRGVLFTSGKGAFAQPVAEHALMLTLALQRRIPLRCRATSWGGSDGLSLFGNRVVIVGAGGIARELIRLMEPFAVEITVVRRSEDEVPGADRTVTFEALDAHIGEADVVVLAAALTPETRGMIGASQLAAMKSTAVLVNIGRGPLVDTDALVNALADAQLYGAGLDVTDPEPLPEGHPLWQHERCIITPHTADTPEMVLPLVLQRVRDNVRAFLDDGRFVGVADPLRGY